MATKPNALARQIARWVESNLDMKATLTLDEGEVTVAVTVTIGSWATVRRTFLWRLPEAYKGWVKPGSRVTVNGAGG